MFTGIVQAIGVIERAAVTGGDKELQITAADLPWQSFDVGESICVNGVCLTATQLSADGFTADVSNETLAVTALAHLAAGDAVNLEPSLAAGDRLGGHFVSGHVDCVGEIVAMNRDARSTRLAIDIPAQYRRFTAAKGSVCVDGVSLTINTVSPDGFAVNIIPHTASATIIGGYQVGTQVNIEVDLLARYLERLLTEETRVAIDQQFLSEHGYA